MNVKPSFPNAPTGVDVDLVHAERSLEVDRVRTLAGRVAEGENRKIGYLSIVLAGHDTVTRLNREYLGHDYETDVLSFPLAPEKSGDPGKAGESGPPGDEEEAGGEKDDENSGRDPIRGEIYVDLDTAAERAPEFEATFEEEAARYVVHGLLHLMGHDDKTDEGQRRMRELENRYLEADS